MSPRPEPLARQDELRVLVVGTGLMGSQIGVEYALGGHAVSFLARDAARTEARVLAAFETVKAHGLASADAVAAGESRVTVIDSLDAVVDAPRLVVESVPEDVEVKVSVLGQIAGAFPDAVLASNTSSISITRLGAALGVPDRVIGAHYWNPPLLMPLVEIVSGDQTDPATAALLHNVLTAMGKEPVPVKRDVPGFVWNRLQLALLREVLWLVEHDVTTPQAIDRVVREGLARRLRYCGPFETIALGGVDAWNAVAANLFPVLSTASEAPDLRPWLAGTIADLDELGRARDAGLAADLKDSR